MRWAPARELPAPFWWLFAGMLVMTSASFVSPFLALYLATGGHSVAAAGSVVALFGLGSLPAGPVAGYLSDRFGRRPVLIGSLLLASALTAMLPLLDSLPLLGADVLGIGFAMHGWWPPSTAVIADVVAADRRSDAYGLLHWIRNAGFAISYAAGGALAMSGYRRLFLIDASSTLVFALLVAWALPETRPAVAAEHRRGAGATSVLGDGNLMAVLGLTLALAVALYQFMSTLPIIMARAGMGPAIYGRVMAVNGVLILLFQPWLSSRVRRFDQGRVLATAALLIGGGTGLYALAGSGLAYAGATAVWTFGEILMFPVLPALVAELSPPEARGRYQGAMGLAFGTGLALAPALGSRVLEQAGPTVLWAGCALVGVLAAAGHLLAARRRRAAAPAASTP